MTDYPARLMPDSTVRATTPPKRGAQRPYARAS